MKTPNPSVQSSKSPDPIQTSIDAVLTGLREAEPSPGLERRLLRTLTSPPATSTRLRRHLPWLSSTTHPHLSSWAAAASALAAVLLLTIALHHQHQPPITARRVATPSANVPETSSIASKTARLPSGHQQAQHVTFSHAGLDRGATRRESIAHVQADPNSRHGSYPAPPMPLTDQEKLLLRVARSASPKQSTVINPSLRASLTARDREEFQLFFISATTIRKDEVPSN